MTAVRRFLEIEPIDKDSKLTNMLPAFFQFCPFFVDLTWNGSNVRMPRLALK